MINIPAPGYPGAVFCALVQLSALRSAQLLPVSISSPPIVAGFLLPIPCGGSGGVLSGLFFGGIICHLPILSACVGFLVPSRHGRRIIQPLQGRYRPYTGRFQGVASCTTPGAFARPAPSWRLPGGRVQPWRSFSAPKHRRFFAGNLKNFSRWIFSRIFRRS